MIIYSKGPRILQVKETRKKTGKIFLLNLFRIFSILLLLQGSLLCPLLQAVDVKGANLKLGKIQCKISGVAELSLNDNLTLSSQATPWNALDLRLRFIGNSSFSYKLKKSQTTLTGFGNFSETDYVAKSVTLMVVEQFAVNKKLTQNFNFNYTTTNYFHVINETEFVNFEVYKITSSSTLNFPWRIKTKTDLTYDYNDDHKKPEDHRKYAVDQKIFLSVLPKISGYAGASFLKDEYLSNDPQKQLTTYLWTFALGVELQQIFKRLSGSCGMGLKIADNPAAPLIRYFSGEGKEAFHLGTDNRLYLDAAAELNWKIGKLQHVLKAHWGVHPTFGTNRIYAHVEKNPIYTDQILIRKNPFVFTSGIDLKNTWSVLPTMDAKLNLKWDKRYFPIGDRDDNNFEVQPIFDFGMGKYYIVTLEYNYKKNISNQAKYNYQVNTINLKTSVKL